MVRPYQRNIGELLEAYREYLLSRISKVRILGESVERELKDVFVELSIVDQKAPQQHAELLGMMDSAMRRRFNPLAEANRATSPELSQGPKRERKRYVKPGDLLRRRSRAIVTGAPGCGKTTLLKYLAMQTHKTENRLAIWIELKAISKPLFAEAEQTAAHNGNLIMQELWLKHLKAQLSFSAAEISLWSEHWQEQFNANEIIVLLDGFDELQDEAIERSLNRCVAEFVSALHENALLISTRPYARHKLGKERLQELEIEPLNQLQIEAFLNCYYPNDAATRSLLKTLRERSSLRELQQVPLLLGVLLRLYRENRFTDRRLELYETIIHDLIHELDRSKSVIRQFQISDERVRLDFLKFLAFERLLRDRLEENEQEANRIAFSYVLLKEKAKKFLAQERSSHNTRDLVNDILATPLLREVAIDTFAFTHLTLQEYLAAQAFAAFYRSDKVNGLEIFCRAYHNSTVVEMEVLPMMLGALTDADSLYTEIEHWSESLTFTNLRLRARGLAYSAQTKKQRVSILVGRLLEFIQRKNSGEVPYREIVISSFVGMSRQIERLIETKAEDRVKIDNRYFFTVACALAQLGSASAIKALIHVMNDRYHNMRHKAVRVLGEIGSDEAVDSLVFALQDKDIRDEAESALRQFRSDKAERALILAVNHEYFAVRASAVDALGAIGTARAVQALTSVLRNKDENDEVRWRATQALGKIGSDQAVDSLVSVLQEEDNMRWVAADALGEIHSDKGVEALIRALKDDSADVRRSVVGSLGMIGSKLAIESLIGTLKDDNLAVCETAAEALGRIGSKRAVDALISSLNDEDSVVGKDAAAALGEIGSEEAVQALILALSSADRFVRESAAAALGETGSHASVERLISVLRDEDEEVRQAAALALGEIGSDKAVEALIFALNDEVEEVRRRAAGALGEIGSDKAVEALISVLQNDSVDVRRTVASSLGMIGSVKAVKTLIATLRDEDSELRLGAADALGKIGSEKAVKHLIAALKRENETERRRAVEALGAIGSAKAVGDLVLALQADDLNLCEDAAEALSQMKSEALLTGLSQSLKQPDASLRKTAVSVLGYYSNDRRTFDQISRLAHEDEDSSVREVAKKAANQFACKLKLLGYHATGRPPQPLGDNESRELFLVGEAFKVVAEAGHIFRPTPNSDWGIDGEIEFKNERGEASGQRVYLQLKSGDSYLPKRKRDGKEIFTIKARHVNYWQSHAYPVLLVIRDSGGGVRWMNVTEYLKRHGTNLKQIEFQGEPFTAKGVKEMRDRFAR